MSLCGEITSKGTNCKNINCHLHCSNIGTCSICLNPVRKTRASSELRCMHLFHKKCINEWKLRGSSTCPDCRAVVDKYKITIRVENTENSQSNIYSPLTSLELLAFITSMGIQPEFSDTQIDISLENDSDLNSFFRDLGIRLADLDPAIFNAE